MKQKTKNIIAGILIIWIVIGIFFVVGKSLGLLVSSGELELFAKPIWGRMECGKEDVLTTVTTTISKNWDNNWINCGASVSELAEECGVYIDGGGDHWYTTDTIRIKWRICTIGGACGIEKSGVFYRSAQDQKIGDTLLSGQTMQLVVESYYTTINIESDIDKKFYRFKLFDYFAGGKRVINSQSCNIPYEDESTGDNIQDKVLQNSYSSEGGGCITGAFNKGTWCNYVHDYAFGPGTNVFNHPTQGEVYCTGDSIYSIVKMGVESGKLIKLDPTYNDFTEDNKNIKGLGNFLGYVDCCPNVPKCTDDFVFEDVPDDCVTDVDCPGGGGWVFYDSQKVAKYSCKSNLCVLSNPVPVKCSQDADCPSGYTCSMLGNIDQWQCVKGGECSKLGEGCLKTADCCQDQDKLICEQNKCTKSSDDCKTCWAWLKDKMGIQQDCDIGILRGIWDALKCPFVFLKLALILISSLVALLFGQQFADKTFRNIPYWATWVIAILFSGLIGVLAYFFLEWYYVIPVLLVLFVFGIIVNAIPGGKYIMGAMRRR